MMIVVPRSVTSFVTSCPASLVQSVLLAIFVMMRSTDLSVTAQRRVRRGARRSLGRRSAREGVDIRVSASKAPNRCDAPRPKVQWAGK